MAWLPLCGGAAPLAAQAPALRTAPERTQAEATTRYGEAVRFVQTAAAASPDLHAWVFGVTTEGRGLPVVLFQAEADAASTPAAVRACGTTRVLVLANIHAGEVDGKEAVLELLREAALGQHAAWRDALSVLFVPVYNADGNERVALGNRPAQWGPLRGMGQRPNAQGLDLNRDFVKAAAPETRALLGLLRTYDPHVVVDLHTTNGSFHAYHLTYSPPLHPDTAPALPAYLTDTLFPAVTDAVFARTGFRLFPYGNTPDTYGPEGWPRGWFTFDYRPRFSTNYIGLRNRFGILSESYSYASFADRIAASKAFVAALLDAATRDGTTLQRLAAEADRTPLPDSIALAATWRDTGTQTVLLGRVDTLRNPYDGTPMWARRDTLIPEAMPQFTAFVPTRRERVPARYLVPDTLQAVLELLDLHGIAYQPLLAPPAGEVERFQVAAVERGSAFQGRTTVTVEGHYTRGFLTSAQGYVEVFTTQPLGRLVFLLLEPQSDDGLVRWDVFGDALQPGRVYPVLRQ